MPISPFHEFRLRNTLNKLTVAITLCPQSLLSARQGRPGTLKNMPYTANNAIGGGLIAGFLCSTWCDLCWPQLLPPYALASICIVFSVHSGAICLQILRATFFDISKWSSSLHEAIAPKRLELQIRGCAKIEDNSKLFMNLK